MTAELRFGKCSCSADAPATAVHRFQHFRKCLGERRLIVGYFTTIVSDGRASVPSQVFFGESLCGGELKVPCKVYSPGWSSQTWPSGSKDSNVPLPMAETRGSWMEKPR